MAANVAKARKGADVGELSADQKSALLFHHVTAYENSLANKKNSDAKLKNVCKLARSELGDDGIDRIKTVLRLRTPEGEAEIKSMLSMTLAVADAVASPIARQFDLFSDKDRTPAEDRAYAEGKRDGLAGIATTNTWAKGTPPHAKYEAGYKIGQAVLKKGFRPLTPLERAAAPKGEQKTPPAAKAPAAAKKPASASPKANAKPKGGKKPPAAKKGGPKLSLVKAGATGTVKDIIAKAGGNSAAVDKEAA